MIILDRYAFLRLFAVGIKFLSILFIPVIFEIKEVALFSIILAAERFVSFVCSMEIHSYFNRKLIQRKYFVKQLNNQHFPLFVVGIILSILMGLTYVWLMDICNLYFYIMALAIFGSIQNELIRRAQALSKNNIFSILNALKSTSLALTIIITLIVGVDDFFIFLKIFVFLSILASMIGVYGCRNLCAFSIHAVYERIKNVSYLYAAFSVISNFIIQGISIFGLAIIERTLILSTFTHNNLASHYSIQSIALAALILMDIFFWGPNYSKLISEFRCEKTSIFSALVNYSKIIVSFQGLMVFSFLIGVYFLAYFSNNWKLIVSENIVWVSINILLIIIIPIDTFFTYFVHAKGIDNVNAKSGIIGLGAMAGFLMFIPNHIYIPFGIFIFYLVCATTKLVLCRRY